MIINKSKNLLLTNGISEPDERLVSCQVPTFTFVQSHPLYNWLQPTQSNFRMKLF